MSAKWWWLVYALIAWQFARTTISAFHVPWSWTGDQCLCVFYLVCAVSAFGYWGLLWQRGGIALVKERWALRQQRMGAPVGKKAYLWSFVFWIVLAVALVVMFNMIHR